MITADELNKATSAALGFQTTPVNYTAAPRPKTTADFFAGVNPNQAAPGLIAAFNASNAMAGSEQAATNINADDRYKEAQVANVVNDNRYNAANLGLSAYKTILETPLLAAKSGTDPMARYGFAKSGVIPGKVDLTVADDTTINAKKGEYVLSVEDVALLGGAEKVDSMVKGMRVKAGLPATTGAKRADEPDHMGRMDKGFGFARGGSVERKLYPGVAEEAAAPYTGFGSKVSGLMRGSINDLARGFVGDLSAPAATDADTVRQMLGGGIGQSETATIKTPIVSLNLSGLENKSVPTTQSMPAQSATPTRPPRTARTIPVPVGFTIPQEQAAPPTKQLRTTGAGTGFIRDESTGKVYSLSADDTTGDIIYTNPSGTQRNLGAYNPQAGFGISPELLSRIAAGNMTEREKFTAQEKGKREDKLELIKAAAEERRATQAEAMKEKRLTTIATAADPAAAATNIADLEAEGPRGFVVKKNLQDFINRQDKVGKLQRRRTDEEVTDTLAKAGYSAKEISKALAMRSK